MRTRILLATFVIAACALSFIKPSQADPCGMVPPIYPGQLVPLARVGLQQTYVSYKDGVETFVIRPGFTGKVDQFGMLIPFPTPPAIRKVPDHIFQHVAAAVDPPEVVVDLRVRLLRRAKQASSSAIEDRSEVALNYKEKVRVLKKEAVGMYEVAVLEAGSASALKRWMDDHGYRYPEGMDKPCNEYVEAGWCFVAVKTRVGQKGGVDPKPGQRTVDSKLPKGSTFDGHVQGMGFRFKSDELVVPMRLSAFNEGELRNVVYLLTDGPRKIRAIPEEYVVRQISGKQLYQNLTQPLPLRIIGGTEADIPEYRRKQLPAQRNPVPKNGAAGELFASDLLAIQTGNLALPHEEREKELLRIGEHLGLRGADIDKLNNQSLNEQRRKTVEKALEEIKAMTLTVVDGDFPREVLGKQNLTFAEYKMPSRRNRSASYDAKLNGPAPKKEGILKLGLLAPGDHEAVAKRVSNSATSSRGVITNSVFFLVLVAFVGLVFSVRLKKFKQGATCLILICSVLFHRGLCAEDLSYYEKTLAGKNIKADSAGLNAYLSSLHPNEEQKKRAIELINVLGTEDSFSRREDAMAKLLVLPVLPTEELVAASKGGDPEIRWRARKILRLGKPESDRVLYAALKAIEDKAITGVTAELIRAIPLCDKPHLSYAARQALQAAAGPDDATLLRRELKNENVNVRVAVAAALGKSLKEKASKDLYEVLDDPEDQVSLAAARALANFGDRESLTALEKLLSSDDKLVQTSSVLALRGLTGERFGFSAHDEAKKRNESITKWNSWIETKGKTAKLTFPLRPFGTGISYLNGNTLLAFGGRNKVAEFDASGNEVWSFTTAQNTWSAEKLANGNVLIAAHGQQQVIEVDRKGNTVWQYRSNHPLNAKQLLNGNYLIAVWSGNQAIEVDPQKNIVWQYKTQSQCSDVHRLENGNTLVSEHQGNVKEITPEGKVVWQYPTKTCYGVQPLPNGNVIITNISGPVIEVTRDKQIVWEFSEPGAVDAFRLPNGNTLITGNSRFIEVTRDKKIVWTKSGASYGTARR